MSALNRAIENVFWFPFVLPLIGVQLTRDYTAIVVPQLELCSERRVTPFRLIEGRGNCIDVVLTL